MQPKSVLLTLGSLRVGDAEVIPLGGVGSVKTVYCNEGGEYTIYDADERGFSNPKGLWGAPAEVAVIGDSYTQGACVPRIRASSRASASAARAPSTSVWAAMARCSSSPRYASISR